MIQSIFCFENNSRTAISMTTVIPITTKRSTKTARKWQPRFSAFFLFSKQLPNSHLYDFHHPFNHRKVYQNDPPNDSTFCILKLYIFPIDSALKYSHNSKPENHGSVTFSENRKSFSESRCLTTGTFPSNGSNALDTQLK